MAIKPELLTDYNSKSHPVSAKCSNCGVQMPLMKSDGASSAESNKWFAIQFDLHIRREDCWRDAKKLNQDRRFSIGIQRLQ